METSKAIQNTEQNKVQPITRTALSSDELKRLSDLFSLLIQIDQRNKKKAKK